MDGYTLTQAGAATHEPLPYARDCDGEHISDRNPNFCELTVLYWIWKNSQEPYKGLVHYRRFFCKYHMSSSMSDIYSHDALTEMLKSHDIVLPRYDYMKINVEEQLTEESCPKEVIPRLRRAIGNLCPEYLDTLDTILNEKKVIFFNMMFCKAELFDSYCSWLFPILFEVEKTTDMTGYTPYQKRLYGFLSERLLNVWVRKNGFKIKHLPILNTEQTNMQRAKDIIRQIYYRCIGLVSK